MSRNTAKESHKNLYNQKSKRLENLISESVNGILKTELLEDTYPSFEKAKEGIALAISTYNHLLTNHSMGDLTPFEVHSLNGAIKPNRLWMNYYKLKVKELPRELV